MTEDQLMVLMEEMIRGLFKEVLAIDLPNPFPRLTYQESMRRFGSDRPDLRVYTKFVGIYGAKGLAYIKVNAWTAQGRAGLQSPIVKNLTDDAIAGIMDRTGAQDGDLNTASLAIRHRL